jgi:hypothetical protein
MGAMASVVLLVLATGAGKTPEPTGRPTYLDVIVRHPSELGEGGQVVEFLGDVAEVKVATDSHCTERINVSVKGVRRGEGSCSRYMGRLTRELTDLLGEPQPGISALIPTFKGKDVGRVAAIWVVEHGTVEADCVDTPEGPKRKTKRVRLSVTRKWQLTPKSDAGSWQRKYLGLGGEDLHGCDA